MLRNCEHLAWKRIFHEILSVYCLIFTNCPAVDMNFCYWIVTFSGNYIFSGQVTLSMVKAFASACCTALQRLSRAPRSSGSAFFTVQAS